MSAFNIQNENSESPVLIVVDHASNALPQDVDKLGLDESVFSRHMAWDIGALNVARLLGERFGSTVISSCYSRLLVDLNRFPDSPTWIPEVSDGLEIPGNLDLTHTQRLERAENYFWPYQNAVSDTVKRIESKGQTPVLVSIHSFTPALSDGSPRPWHIGVLWNEKDDRLAGPLLNVLHTNSSICVGDNQPYHANNPHGYTVKTHGEDHGYPHALIEIRQDMIDSDEGAAEWANILGDALNTVFDKNGYFQMG